MLIPIKFQLMTKKNILSAIFLCFIPLILFSQKTISGEVIDENNLPLLGANVIVKDSNKGTVTDFDGKFNLLLDENESELIISYTGFETLNINIENQSFVSVVLKESSTGLDEVVITALGFEAKNDELGYANSTIKSDIVESAAETTLINSLSGKASGVRISRSSGDPGAGAYIQIRGISTIDRNAQPLIVIDGIPVSNGSRGSNTDQIYFAAQSRLNDLNPSDIESVNVLKGASAAALWGTRALGGVIVIKTKSGKYNQKLQIKVKSSYSYDEIVRKYPLQTTFGQGDNGVFNQRARDSWGDKISSRIGGIDDYDTSSQYFLDQNGATYYPILNKNSTQIFDDSNFDKVFSNGEFFENNISLSAGNNNSTIFASISDFDQKGIIINNSDYRRTTARINVNHNLTSKIKISTNTSYSKTKSNRILRGRNSSGLYLGLLRTPADFDISGYRGDYYESSISSPISNRHRSYREPLGADDTPVYNNPLWTINEQENLVDVDRFISSLELKATPLTWLELIGRVGLDTYAEHQQAFFTPGSASGLYSTGYFEKELARNSIFNMDYIAKAFAKINDKIQGDFLVGFNYNDRKLITDGSQISNFTQFNDVVSGIRDIDNALAENRTVGSTFGQERTVGVYGSASINIDEFLFLNGTLRAESASTFGDGNKTFYFPSASVAWQFSKLNLFDDTVLSFGKLRASYGEVGVQPSRYQTSSYFLTADFSDNLGGSLSGDLYNGSLVPSRSRGSSSLKPERKKELEIGFDIRLFDDNLSISATRFDNKTSDILLDFPTANSRGVTSLYTNGAEIENEGYEIDLNVKIINKRDFSFDLGAVYSKVDNMVSKLDENLSIVLGDVGAVNSRAIQGYPLGVISGSRNLRDSSGNIQFDLNGFPLQDNVNGIIADPNPDWQGSIFPTIRYKDFTLSALFETFQGADIIAGTKSVLLDLGRWHSTGIESVASQNLLDYNGSVIPAGTTFRGQIFNFGAGPVALTESWYNGIGGWFGGGTRELAVEDGSWTRLRELSLTYDYQSDWLINSLGIESVKASLTGRNLIIWTDFEGNDPDTSLQGVSVARGIDYFNNPSTKSYVFTLELNF